MQRLLWKITNANIYVLYRILRLIENDFITFSWTIWFFRLKTYFQRPNNNTTRTENEITYIFRYGFDVIQRKIHLKNDFPTLNNIYIYIIYKV